MFRTVPRFLLAALATVLVGCTAGESRSVLVIVIDTLRQDRVSAYGYRRPTSPNIDRLARAGALADGLSPTSWTKPATASILTGLHPLRHQTYRHEDVLPRRVTTLAEVFREAGYQTMAISANNWISPVSGMDQGFDEFYSLQDFGHGHAATADTVNLELLPRLETLRHPFFLYVHYIDPHTPYVPSVHWDGGPLPPELADLVPLDNDAIDPLHFVERSAEIVRGASDLYDAEIRLVDSEIGRLLARLDELGLMESTVSVVTSDHGEEFEEHGRMGHGHTVYSELTRVPLIVHAPGRISPGTRWGTTSLMDIFPLVLELAGLGRAPLRGLGYELDGQPGTDRGRSTARAEDEREHLLHLDLDTGHNLAFVQGRWKLVLGKYPYVKALYDLADDPDEQHDLLAASPRDTGFARLAERLVESYDALLRDAFEPTTTAIDPETVEGLHALGYLGVSSRRASFALIPRRIRPATPEIDGLLGWEGHRPEPCVEPGRLPVENQLLRGWHLGQKEVGRWTRPVATVALGVPRSASGRHVLTLRGLSFRRRPFTLIAELAGQRIFERTVSPAPFEEKVVVAFPLAAGSQALLRVETVPPIPLGELGTPDKRTVGVFLESICLEPSP